MASRRKRDPWNNMGKMPMPLVAAQDEVSRKRAQSARRKGENVAKRDESYQVLARKWRPQTFEEVVGQEGTVQALKNAIAMGRIAHALGAMMKGPRTWQQFRSRSRRGKPKPRGQENPMLASEQGTEEDNE